MNKRKFSENEPMHKTARFYYEEFKNKTDIDHKTISNERALQIIGRIYHLPKWLQQDILLSMSCLGLIKRSKRVIYLLGNY